MPLDDIVFQMPLKRKALKATPTICRFCKRAFVDKYYEKEIYHKVRCTHCNRVNAEIDVDTYVKNITEQAIRHDLGVYGGLGIHQTGKFRDMVKDAYKFTTKEEVDQKLKEFEYNVKMSIYRKKLEEEAKKKRETKITIKRKGEEEYQMGKKK